VSFHVACTPGLVPTIDTLLRASACSVHNLAACKETHQAVLEAFWGEVGHEEPQVWEQSDVAFRGFATPRP
jgi:hypothetical protein